MGCNNSNDCNGGTPICDGGDCRSCRPDDSWSSECYNKHSNKRYCLGRGCVQCRNSNADCSSSQPYCYNWKCHDCKPLWWSCSSSSECCGSLGCTTLGYCDCCTAREVDENVLTDENVLAIAADEKQDNYNELLHCYDCNDGQYITSGTLEAACNNIEFSRGCCDGTGNQPPIDILCGSAQHKWSAMPQTNIGEEYALYLCIIGFLIFLMIGLIAIIMKRIHKNKRNYTVVNDESCTEMHMDSIDNK
eukprot:402906_1